MGLLDKIRSVAGSLRRKPPQFDPYSVAPQGDDLEFELVEIGSLEKSPFDPAKNIMVKAVAGKAGEEIGFGFILAVSNGQFEITKTVHELGRSGQLVQKRVEHWQVPEGYVTDQIAFFSLGAATDRLLGRLEHCFEKTQSGTNVPEGFFAKIILLSGAFIHNQACVGLGKIFLIGPEGAADSPNHYAEFYLGLNTHTRKVWLGWKDRDYDSAILAWLTGKVGAVA